MTSSCPESFPSAASSAPRPPPSARANKCSAPFPAKFHEMLAYAEEAGLSHVVSWLPHGRAFRIHDNALFMSSIAGMFFKATKMRSIHRQLNLWGFRRVLSGKEKDAWHHERFVRGRPDDTMKMVRTKCKGGRRRPFFHRVGLLDDAPDSCGTPPIASVEAQGAPSSEDGSTKAKAEEDCIAPAISRAHLVSPWVRPALPSAQLLPLPRMDPLALAPTKTLPRDRFEPREAFTQTSEPLQNWTVEPLPTIFGNEKAWCDVDDDEFSLFIGLVIKDPSGH